VRVKWFDTTLNKNRTYLPDFHIPKYNLFLDVKNQYKMHSDRDKIQQLILLLPLYVASLKEMMFFIKQLAIVENFHSQSLISVEYTTH